MSDIVERLNGYADPQYKKELLGKGSLDGVISDLLDDAVEAGRKITRLRDELDLSQKAVDVLESNARQQAKLLADTGRELERARGMVEWHDISTIPKDGTSVLVSMRGGADGPYWVVFWNGKHFEDVESGSNISDSANIWMRIPSSPPFTSTERQDA